LPSCVQTPEATLPIAWDKTDGSKGVDRVVKLAAKMTLGTFWNQFKASPQEYVTSHAMPNDIPDLRDTPSNLRKINDAMEKGVLINELEERDALPAPGGGQFRVSEGGMFKVGDLTQTQKNGSLKNVDKNVRKAVLQTLKREDSAEAARIRKNLDELTETAWAVTAIKGLAIREFFHLATEGKGNSPLANQILDSDIWGKQNMRSSGIVKAFLRGPNTVRAFIATYDSILTDNKKAEKSVSTSMKNCDPSRACADHCYDAIGTGGNPASIVKSELMEWAAEFYPELLADRIESQYRASPLAIAGLALRLNDKG